MYYIDQSSILRDIYSTNYGVSWIRGKLGEKKVKPVSGSGVAAITYSAREPAIECIHVFYQLEGECAHPEHIICALKRLPERETHVLKELIYNGTTWGDGELACDLAIAGTKLTAVTPRIGNHNEIYLYYQYPPSFNMASYDGRKWDY